MKSMVRGRKFRKMAAGLLAAAMLCGTLAGCGVQNTASSSASGSASSGSSAASESTSSLDEKTLNIYTALEDEQVSDYLTSFREAHPDVTINITRESTGVITSKLLAEKDNPQADVIWGLSATSLLELDQENMLEPYAPDGVDKILDTFKDTENETPHWVGIDAWETAFLVNKDVLQQHGVTDIPQGYEDLLDPQYEGLIAMSDPSSSGTGLLTVNGILSLYGEEEGWKFLQELDKNVAVYLHSGSAPAKQTAAGEYGIGVSFGYRCIQSAQDLGYLGVVVFPEEGSGYDIEANALVARAEGEKEIAKEFLDWAIQDQQMEKYATNYPIVATGVDTSALPEGYTGDPVGQLLDMDFQWCAANRESILEKWTELFSAKSMDA